MQKKGKITNQERKFWSEFDLSKHFKKEDFSNAIFPNLKPSSRSISIRMPEYILMRLKEKAQSLNIPYQSLIKQYVAGQVLSK